MKFKRFLYSIFAIVLTLILFILPVSAQELPESLQEAAVTLREGIKNWENMITVTFSTDLDSFDGTKNSANDLANQILDLALAHTGVPDEGDYLRFNIGYMEPQSVKFTKQSDGWKFSFTYLIVYWTTPEQEAEVDAEIEALVQSLDLKSDATDYQKIAAIYQYICSTVVYDYENLADDTYGLKFTTYAAAINKTAVCQGYATLFYRLALEAGVDNRVISGYAGEDHSWNIVKLDGVYYNLDATWDAGMFQYQYFLKSAESFLDHDADAQYKTPEFQAAYPVAQVSYQHPDQSGVTEDGFHYQVFYGIAVLTGYSGNATDVVVPAKLDGYPLREVAGTAFYFNNNIKSITFSEGIQLLNSSAILDCCNLKAIHLPSTVNFTASEEPDFKCNVICGPYYCPSVETITVAEGNPNLVVHDNVLYNKEMTILRYFPSGDPREVFEIPEGVLSISAGAFADNQNLKEVKMPDTVLRIQISAFEYCAQLEKINISSNCHFIDQFVFSGTSLKSIHIPASVKSLYCGTFGIDSVVESITIDPANPVYYVVDGVVYGHYSEGCNVDSCHIPGDWLVKYPAGRGETSFTVPEGIVGIEQHAFDCGANLTEVILPDSLQILYNGAFWGCSGLTKITLPENLKKIYNSAFEDCTSLVELVIPAGVEHLGYYVLSDFHNLEQVVFQGDAPEMYEQTFAWQTVDIYYPARNTTWEKVIQMYAHESGVRWIETCETHQFEDKTRAVTCTLTGYTGQECSVCGLVKVTSELIPPTGHDWVPGDVQEPSCERWGGTFYLCTVCGENNFIDEVAPLGHSYDDNGICKICVTYEEGITITEPVTAKADPFIVLGVMLGLPAIIIIIVLIRKAFRKPQEE